MNSTFPSRRCGTLRLERAILEFAVAGGTSGIKSLINWKGGVGSNGWRKRTNTDRESSENQMMYGMVGTHGKTRTISCEIDALK
jgi:hypothetical protein